MIEKSLALHSASAVAAHELFYIRNADTVKVTDDTVLEAACRNCEFERQLLVLIMVQPVDQAARKRIAAADAVDNVPDFVFFRHVKVLAVVQARRPAVPVRAVALAQRDGNTPSCRSTPAPDVGWPDMLVCPPIARSSLPPMKRR